MQADAEGLSYDLLSSWGGKSWLSRSLGSIPVLGPPRGWAARMDRKDQVNTSWPQPAFYTWRDTTLNEKKARFQQRQLEEKEQKLVRMYESAQAQALKRVGGAATTAPQNPGKVRQMFEERRTRAGIDKSHPLQPLGPPAAPGATRPQGSRPAPRPQQNGGQRVQTTAAHPDGDYVRKEVVEIKQRSSNHDLPNLSKTHRFESERIFRDHNLNNDEFLDDVTFPDGISFDQLTLDPISNKLPNVGGALPSQRQAKQSESNNNIIVTKNGTTRKTVSDERVMAPRGNAMNSPNGEGRGKVSPVERARATPPKTLRTTTTIKPKVSQTSSPTVATPPTPVKARTPVEPKPRTPIRTVSAASPKRMASKAESPPSGEGSGERCRICNRQFASERLAKHEEICARQKKRKPYDAIKHRIAGTDVEPYVKVVKKAGKVQTAPRSGPVTLRPNNWRKKHEDFINAIRAAKQVTLHIKKGGKLSDLPPPPPSDTSDYVSCPHCNRRFNASAAERHIPKCASFQFNKKPQPAKKR